jgi:hypothetical protein
LFRSGRNKEEVQYYLLFSMKTHRNNHDRASSVC